MTRNKPVTLCYLNLYPSIQSWSSKPGCTCYSNLAKWSWWCCDLPLPSIQLWSSKPGSTCYSNQTNGSWSMMVWPVFIHQHNDDLLNLVAHLISIIIHQYNDDLLNLVAHVTLIRQSDLDDGVTFPFHQYNYDLLNLVAHVIIIWKSDSNVGGTCLHPSIQILILIG